MDLLKTKWNLQLLKDGNSFIVKGLKNTKIPENIFDIIEAEIERQN